MFSSTNSLIRHSNRSILCASLLGGIAASGVAAAESEHSHAAHTAAVPAKLVQTVRDATKRFTNVNNAGPDYVPMFGCVTGPDHGAMGIHYVNGALVGDGDVDAEHPEALIYEPSDQGLTLVGVEYIVDAQTWLKHHSSPPQLEGQAFQLVAAPNRFGLPDFFELHVWA